MGTFNVELKKVVDDSYEIEVGYSLEDKLIEDIQLGLVGNIRKFAVITDTNVSKLYAQPICEKLLSAGYEADLFVFPAGEKNKTRNTKANIEDEMLEKTYDILTLICEASLVEPKMEDFKKAGIELSDNQMIAIFNYTQQGIGALESFRSE